MAFNNYGTVEIQTGTLALSGGGTHTGTFEVPTGTTLSFSGGPHSTSVGSTIAGAGAFTISGSAVATLDGLINVTGTNRFNGGTANINGNYICTNNALAISSGTANFNGSGVVSPAFVTMSSGTLSGSQNVTVLNQMDWSGGSMSGSGWTIISAGATLNVPGSPNLNGRNLENAGTVIYTGGSLLIGGAVLTNRAGALFEVRSAANLNNPPFTGSRFDNAGTFRKAVSTGTATVFSGMAFNNYGTVEIRSGILAANGGYTSSPSALLNCFIGGTTVATGYGRLQVSGTVTLNGALRVDLINGFVPATNDTFTVLTAGTRSGTFANFFFPSNAATMQLSNTANSVIARVTDVFSVPQPAPLPAGVISWWRAEGNALDSVGTNHGVLTNGATFAAGNAGQTFAFDGVNDYVSVADSPSLKPASVTIEAWVKFFATNGIRIVLVKPLGTNTTFDSYGLALQDGAVLAAICDNSGFGPFLTGPANIVPGQWYHLAYTFNDTNKQQTLYVNGVAAASGTANKTIAYDTNPVLLGADLENGVLGFFHNGLIDEASIYSRALTSDEIATIYNASMAGKQLLPPVILHIEGISPTAGRLFWSTNHSGFHLEYNTSLLTSNWAASLKTPVITGTNFVVTNSLFAAQKFYRLSSIPAPFTPPPPVLSIQRATTNTVRLLWPVDDDRPFNLQSNTNLSTTNWTTAAPAPVISGGNLVVTNPISGTQRFYRLASP